MARSSKERGRGVPAFCRERCFVFCEKACMLRLRGLSSVYNALALSRCAKGSPCNSDRPKSRTSTPPSRSSSRRGPASPISASSVAAWGIPTVPSIERDVACAKSFVVVDDAGAILGTAMLDEEGDPALRGLRPNRRALEDRFDLRRSGVIWSSIVAVGSASAGRGGALPALRGGAHRRRARLSKRAHRHAPRQCSHVRIAREVRLQPMRGLLACEPRGADARARCVREDRRLAFDGRLNVAVASGIVAACPRCPSSAATSPFPTLTRQSRDRSRRRSALYG